MARKTPDAYDVVRRLRYATGSVAVGVSCGKDSVALLDLCCTWFPRVAAFYMYVTPNLSFHEQYLSYLEDRYRAKLVLGRVLRVPHWCLSNRLRDSALRDDFLASKDVPKLTIRDVELHVTKETGVNWFASGQKKIDSLERRAMLNKCDGIMLGSNRAYPLSDWTQRSVLQYLRNRGIPLSPEYAVMPCSYGGQLEGEYLKPIADNFPDDYQRILDRFPFAGAELLRYEAGLKKNPRVRRQA